eukprot:3891008-Lingulodinium_polyedra.AAC.1
MVVVVDSRAWEASLMPSKAHCRAGRCSLARVRSMRSISNSPHSPRTAARGQPDSAQARVASDQ